MSYAIVYSSKTGNTALLAKTIKSALPKETCVYYGSPDEKAKTAELIFAGFWTNQGSCDEISAVFLKGLRDKQVFLFGTAGFGGSEEYFHQILSRTRVCLDDSNTVVGSYMCQGKLPAVIRKRYEDMESQAPERAEALLDNFDRALSHPDKTDLAKLKKIAAAFA